MNRNSGDLQSELAKIEEKTKAAQENSDEIAIRNLIAERGDVYLKYGNKEKHRESYLEAYEKAVGSSKKLDYLMVVL